MTEHLRVMQQKWLIASAAAARGSTMTRHYPGVLQSIEEG
jgi:hypothetical protein